MYPICNKRPQSLTLPSLLLILVVSVTACTPNDTTLKASGTVEAVEVVVAPEIAGRVAEVLVIQGDQVKAGDPLFRLEGDLLEAQRKHAMAALESAKANLGVAQAALEVAQAARDTAQATVDSAEVQHQLTINAARLAYQPLRVKSWNESVPSEFNLPVWYFDKAEKIAAAQKEVQARWEALLTEQANLKKVLESASNADLKAAEERLAAAETAFRIADEVQDRPAQDGKEINDFAKGTFDTAKAELDAAQQAYDDILTAGVAEDVLEARARLMVAREQYETALDYLNSLLTGEDALEVKASQAALNQAKVALAQAEANVAQAKANVQQAEKAIEVAQAELDLLDVQMNKLIVRTAVSGVVMTRSVEPGEVVQPGSITMTIGQLDQLTITVYVPEDRYGEIQLGQHAQVTVDSFPNQVFDAVVTRIADEAEYTPRNVQTEEGRRTTVFAIELSVIDPQGKLKPGMPADVTFGE